MGYHLWLYILLWLLSWLSIDIGIVSIYVVFLVDIINDIINDYYYYLCDSWDIIYDYFYYYQYWDNINIVGMLSMILSMIIMINIVIIDNQDDVGILSMITAW